MTASFQTPVILILFNRPDRVRRLLDVLREVRPAHILAIADGPRPAHPSDVAACRAAREALAFIDWPCALEREFSDENLGSSTRTATGLDWAFRNVPQAIVFEDDLLPDPSFMYWAEDMLERFRADPDVLMVSGYNRLGRWPIGQSEAPAADHIRSRHGSLWGWATTSAAWHCIQTTDVSGDPGHAFADLVALGLDPLLATHLTPTLEAFRRGRNVAFDRLLGNRVAARRGVAVVSPINLVQNTGIGPGATFTTFADDFSGLVPVGSAVVRPGTRTSDIDAAFDRAALFVELMTRCADPPMALRLARLTDARKIVVDPAVRHHLAPFRSPKESLNLLDHLSALGVTSPHFERLRNTLATAIRRAS
jgi:hypothetical protein